MRRDVRLGSGTRRWPLRRREMRWLVGLGAFALVAIAQILAPEASRAERAALPVAAAAFFAIDGDTIERASGGERVRLANIDTAETGARAQCAAERQHGEQAKRRVREILGAAAQVRIEPVGRIDAYGRTIAYVEIDGRDLGETLMVERLARPWRGHREPWCGAGGRLAP